MMHSLLLCQVASPEASKLPLTAKRSLGQTATLFLIGLSLSLVVLVVTLSILRRHAHRARSHGALAEELEAARLKKLYKPDPWTEAGKRLDPNKPFGNEDDTVDIDPRELHPDDIQPPDDTPPQNGHGGHGGARDGKSDPGPPGPTSPGSPPGGKGPSPRNPPGGSGGPRR